jgi:hypothetical protein
MNTIPTAIDWEPERVAKVEEPLELYPTSPPRANHTPEVIKERATKAHIASGEDSPGIDALIDQIQSGLEEDIAAGIAQRDYHKKQKASQDLVAEYFSTQGMAANSPEEIAYVQQLAKSEPAKLSSIIEKKYADNRLTLSLASDTSGAVDAVLEKAPDRVDEPLRKAGSRIVVKELSRKYRQDLSAVYDQAGMFRKSLDFVKGFVPLLDAYNVSTVAEGIDSEGVFTQGAVLRQKYRRIFSMTEEEAADYLEREIYQKALNDPGELQYAIEFLAGLESYSAEQAAVDTVTNLVEAGLELTPLGLAADFAKVGTKAAGKVVAKKATKAAREAVEAVPAGEATTLADDAAKAAGDSPRATTGSSTPKVPPRDGSTPEQAVDTFNEQLSVEDVFGPNSNVSVDLARVGEIYPLKGTGDYNIVGFNTDKGEVLLKDGSVEKVTKGGGTLWDKSGNEISLNAVSAFKNAGGKKWVVVRQPGQPAVVLPGVQLSKEEAVAEAVFNAVEAKKVTGAEKVKNAAVRFNGKIYEGPNHGMALDRAATELGKTQDELFEQIDQNTEGFMTTTGRFVSREEADVIAKGQGQKKPGSNNANYLGSEDLVPSAPKMGKGSDGRIWPKAFGLYTKKGEATGFEGLPDKAVTERIKYLENKISPDKENVYGPNSLSVDEQNKLVMELDRLSAEEMRRSLNPNSSLYIPPEKDGPSDSEVLDNILFGDRSLDPRNKTARVTGPEAIEDVLYVSVDVPNPKTGEVTRMNVPATDEVRVALQVDAATKDALKGSTDPVETMAAHGDADGAALQKAVEELRDEYSVSKPDIASVEKLSEKMKRNLASIFDPFTRIVGRAPTKQYYKEVINLTKKNKSLLKSQKRLVDKLWSAIDDAGSTGAIRVTAEAAEQMKPLMQAQLVKEFPSLKDAMANVRIEWIRETDAGGLRVNGGTFVFTRPDGSYFTGPHGATAAHHYAKDIYKLPDGYYNVVPRGSGFAIEMTRILDETNPNFSRMIIDTKTKTPVTFASAFTSYLKGGAATSSEWLAQNLHASAHHAKALHKAFSDMAAEIGPLKKAEKNNLEKLLEAMRDVMVEDPITGERRRGKWANSAFEFERMYKNSFGSLPSDAQKNAYFTVRTLHDFDHIIRNRNLYTTLARKAVEEFQFFIPVKPDAIEEGVAPTTKWLKQKSTVLAKAVDELPKNQLDNSILILDAENLSTKVIFKAKDGTAEVDALVAKGYRIYQLANADQRPFRALNNSHVQFVVAKDLERRPLSLDRLPYTEGGHVRAAENVFIKQPRFETTETGQKLYVGDAVVAGVSSTAEGKRWAEAIETARKLLNAGDDKVLDAHLAKNTPYTLNEFKSLYEDVLNPDGSVKTPARFSKDIPFGWTEDGQGMNDAAKSHMPELRSYFDGVVDTIDDPNNLFRTIDKKFTGGKDEPLRTIEEGTDRAWAFAPARHVSPLALLEETAAELSRTLSLSDLKISAAMHWIEEAAPYLETPLDELRVDPWNHFMNPQWKGQYIDIGTVRALNASRVNVLGFIGQAKNPMDTTVEWVKQKAMDSVYTRFGGKTADWVDDNLIGSIPDPIQFMRQFAFHTKLGMFNPVQLFLQTQTMFHTYAVTGNIKRVGSALSGLILSQAARMTTYKNNINHLDKVAQKLGWKPGEWLESQTLLKKIKLDLVEGEAGVIDVHSNPVMFQSAFGKFLDKGTLFFKESERAVRINAWHVAFKEFRDKNPTKVIGNLEINEILRRQELLSVNMTRSSNANWQRGLTGPMTQFMGYQARIAEQLLGKQLTPAEKLRVVTMYAGLYGVPVSLGAATFMQIPGASQEDIRKYALSNGIDINSGIAGVAMNGIPAAVVSAATGYQFAYGQRVGPGGLTTLRDLVDGDKTLFETFMGAGYSIGKDFLTQVYPEDGDILGAMLEAPSKSIADYANVFSTVSTVNNTNKLLWALFTQRNMTRNGVDLGEIDSTSAVIRFLTGMEEQRFLDSYLAFEIGADLTEYLKEIGKEYKDQYKRAMKLPTGSPEREEVKKKMRALLEGVDPSARDKIMWQARQPDRPLDEAAKKLLKEKVLEPKGLN